MFGFYEFFAGGGMARAGLGPGWTCLFANDFDHKKSAVYRKNWGDGTLKTCDVRKLKAADIEGRANLVWASFPCQDLSLAGAGNGLKGDRSGAFWPFWDVVRALVSDSRAPDMIVLENVCGTLTSRNGDDFAAICSAFQNAGYRFGAMVIDAAYFVPQSRPRLFVVGVRDGMEVPAELLSYGPGGDWHNWALRGAYGNLPAHVRQGWIWWAMPAPARRNTAFADLIEESPDSVAWHTAEETQKLLDMMSKINRAKVGDAVKFGRKVVGAVYKRTRRDENGRKAQRAEIRFDDVAGCLRTPAGGSSRQLIMVVEAEKVRSRLISSRETARLMGLADEYQLPENYNEAYHLTGDGVVVPVVRHIAAHLIEPLLTAIPKITRAAA